MNHLLRNSLQDMFHNFDREQAKGKKNRHTYYDKILLHLMKRMVFSGIMIIEKVMHHNDIEDENERLNSFV
jgi:hypothetical protein